MHKKTAILTQVIMTFLMAGSMSGIMLLIAIGPGQTFIETWPKQWIIAWPIAFVVTQVLFPFSNHLARKILGGRD